MSTILLTNDDGYLSEGIQQLKRFLSKDYDVYVVAPDRERSAISMSLTINHPLRLSRMGEKEFVIDGTPADCVNIALQKIMPHWPDFLISGMNEGENLCEDVFFSGTVAGAFTGHLYGIPSMAVSLITDPPGGQPLDFEEGARITARILEQLLTLKNTSVVYNMNIPPNHNSQLEITTIGLKQYQPSIVERTDPRNRKYFWIGTGHPTLNGDKGSDLAAVKKGNISLSVLQYDLNSPEEFKKLHEVFNGNKI
jgi:5'-nucleotidase